MGKLHMANEYSNDTTLILVQRLPHCTPMPVQHKVRAKVGPARSLGSKKWVVLTPNNCIRDCTDTTNKYPSIPTTLALL
ncbi:unnamed protein product [Sphenostylis stenocarpa]|uniref:Uncharacterized protein n=1 Tax=Sphenostylis stenocarpa TaxID=92480 RepID=A0AA86SYX1_9FABA|nr:unnamed protein product [Sphenostylis stenocarpa]